jgi:hypothetical protein
MDETRLQHTIQQHPSRLWIVQATQEGTNCALARATATHNGNDLGVAHGALTSQKHGMRREPSDQHIYLSRVDVHVESLQNIAFRSKRIRKRDILEGNLTSDTVQCLTTTYGQLRLTICDFENSSTSTDRFHQIRIHC